MCTNVLSYFINHKYLQFLNKVTKIQQGIFVILGIIFIILIVNNFTLIYYSKGITKLFFLLLAILFLLGIFFHIIKIFIDNPKYLDNKYLSISYCIQLIGLVIGFIYLLIKFIQLTLLLLLG